MAHRRALTVTTWYGARAFRSQQQAFWTSWKCQCFMQRGTWCKVRMFLCREADFCALVWYSLFPLDVLVLQLLPFPQHTGMHTHHTCTCTHTPHMYMHTHTTHVHAHTHHMYTYTCTTHAHIHTTRVHAYNHTCMYTPHTRVYTHPTHAHVHAHAIHVCTPPHMCVCILTRWLAELALCQEGIQGIMESQGWGDVN